jgi:hypothetical protein
MSKRLPPKWVSKAAPDSGMPEGVDNLPIPAGTIRSGVKQAESDSEATPGAMGQKNGYRECDGDNPKIADSIAFANGKDGRNRDGGPSGSDPSPAMPGA